MICNYRKGQSFDRQSHPARERIAPEDLLDEPDREAFARIRRGLYTYGYALIARPQLSARGEVVR